MSVTQTAMIISLTIVFNLLICCVNSNQVINTIIRRSNKGTQFAPRSSQEYALNNASASSLNRCATRCAENILCRTFIYDPSTFVCQLYQSDTTDGNITASSSASSSVGTMDSDPSFYTNYNRTCDLCQNNRYLVCSNSRCQCPSPRLFWNGNICQNKFYYGDSCNASIECRDDLNLSCIFGSCQLNTAVCKMGATVITFDDIPNTNSSEGPIPFGYKGFSWTNGEYLNVSTRLSSSYPLIRASGAYVAWFNEPLTIQTLVANTTITLNSCKMGSGWGDPISLRIRGFYNNILKNTTTIALNNISTPVLLVFNWYGLNRIVFTPTGPDWLDVGMDNLCITF